MVATEVERSSDMKMKSKIKTVCDVCLYKAGSNGRLCIMWQLSAVQIMINQEQSWDVDCVNC